MNVQSPPIIERNILEYTISLSQLPTELDSRIANYLVDDKKPLSSLSKVSKYYRSVAELLLYMNLTFADDDYTGLTLLMLTLVHRERLSLHIKSLKVDHHKTLKGFLDFGDLVVESAEGARLWAETSAVHAKINEIVQSAIRGKLKGADSRHACRLLTEIFPNYSQDVVRMHLLHSSCA